eukprot:s4558_g3.t3
MFRCIRFLLALHVGLLRVQVLAVAPEGQKGRKGLGQLGPRVMLSVITRNRFWRHALSTLSLRTSVENAQQELPDLYLEWHLIDDASASKSSDGKQSMIQELVEAGEIRNFTRMSRHLGTVRVLAMSVETFLSRADLDFFLHCDDDILMGRTTVARGLRDYMTDVTTGGVLALFVNSWLDDQLSHADPAFGPYAVAPFLGGAAYIVDRKTLTVSGNPWAQAIASNSRITPHEAHVFWLRQLLPSRGHRIWVRWKQPYECQHLGNVNTLNFGKQPEWEPMWAIDHESKRIVEVSGYKSADVRAALWNDRRLLPDYVGFQNAKMRNPLKSLTPLASAAGSGAWSPWAYRRRHLNYLEIGTADFDTLLSRHVWREDVQGISVEPLRIYFERLPSHGGANKLLLNVAVSDYDGFDTLYFVQPELVGPHRGSESLCDQALVSKLGLDECLPGWVRGTSSLKRPPEGVRQLLGKRAMDVMGRVQVPCMTYETLLTVYGIGSLDVLKIDAEGFDAKILRQVLELGRNRGLWPWQVQFEKNILSDWEMLDAQVIELHREGYRCWDPEPLDDAMELRTLRRDDVLGKPEAGPPLDPPLPVAVGVADAPEAPEPEGLALSGKALSPGEGQSEASASPTGDVPTATTRMDGEELEAECEVLEAAAQSLKLSHQSSHLTELVSEGPAGPSLSEKPEAGLAWEAAEAGELVPTSAMQHDAGHSSAGVQEVKAGTLQDSVSSPAHSAVTTPATSGYQTLSKGVDPVEVACDPVPGAVFTAEDEAVMGLKRRGGVEVVVEPPRAKATSSIQREPLSARSARSREGDSGDPDPPSSEPRKPSSGHSGDRSGDPAPTNSLGLQGAPAPMVARPHAQGRPPRQPATPAGSGSTESEQPSLPRRRTPSLGRRPSLPKADSARRSSSAGRSGNRKLVRNALEKYCLKGDANREQRELVLKSFDEDLERFDRFIILFRSIHTGRHDLRALYGFSEGSWSRVLQILPSPASLEERMVVQCLRYDSGGKEFKEVPASQEPLSVADAVFLHPQFLQRSRVIAACHRKALKSNLRVLSRFALDAFAFYYPSTGPEAVIRFLRSNKLTPSLSSYDYAVCAVVPRSLEVNWPRACDFCSDPHLCICSAPFLSIAWPEAYQLHSDGAVAAVLGAKSVSQKAACDLPKSSAQPKRCEATKHRLPTEPAEVLREVMQCLQEQNSAPRPPSRILGLYSELRHLLRSTGQTMAEVAAESGQRAADLYSGLTQLAIRSGKHQMLNSIIDDMVQSEVPRSLAFYESVMKQLAVQRQFRLALRVYDRLVEDGLETTAITCSCLVRFAAEVGDFTRAREFFEKLSSMTTPSIRFAGLAHGPEEGVGSRKVQTIRAPAQIVDALSHEEEAELEAHLQPL